MADLYYIEQGYFTPDGYYVYIANADAAVNSSSTLSATVGVIKQNSSSIDAIATVDATISHIHGADLQAFSNAEVTTVISVFRNVNSTINSEFTTSNSADRIRSSDVNLSSSFEFTVETGQFQLAQADINSTASISVDASANRVTTIAQDTLVTLSAQGDRVRYADSNVSSEFTISSDVSRTRDLDSSLSSQATLTNTILRIFSADIAATSLFTPSLTVSVSRNLTAVLDSVSSVSVTAIKSVRATSNLSSTSTVNAQVNVQRSAASTQSSAVTQTTAARKTVRSAVTLSGVFTPTLTVRVFKNQVAVFSSTASISITARKTARTSSSLASVVSVASSAARTLRSSSNLLSAVNTSILGGLRQNIQSNLIFGFNQIATVYELGFRPLQVYQINGTVNIDTNISRIGDGSLFIGTTTSDIQYYGRSIDFTVGATRGADSTRGMALEFWVRPTISAFPAEELTLLDFVDTSGQVLFKVTVNQTFIRFYLIRTVSGNNSLTVWLVANHGGVPQNTWTRFTVGAQGGTTGSAVYKNGTRIDTGSGISGIEFDHTVFPRGYLRIGNAATNGFTGYFDNIWYGTGGSTYATDNGINPANTTASGTVRTNVTGTRFLGYFNSDTQFRDITDTTQIADANLQTTTTLTAGIGYNTRATANLISTSNLTVNLSKTTSSNSALTSTATLSSVNIRIRFASSLLSNVATQTATVRATKRTSSAIQSSTTLSTINSRTRASAITTQSIATQLSAVAKIGQGLIGLDVITTSAVSAIKTASAVSLLNSVAQVNADARRFRNVNSTTNSNFAQTALTDRIRNFEAIIESESTVNNNSVKLVEPLIALSATFTSEANNSQLIGFSADLNSFVTVNATILRIKSSSSSLNCQFNLTVDPVKAILVESAQQSNCTVTINVNRIRNINVQSDSIASQLTAVAKTGQGFITLESQCSMIIDSVKRTGNIINAQSNLQLSVITGVIKPSAASLSITSSLTGFGVTGVVGESYNTSQFTQQVLAIKTVRINSQLTALATISSQISRTRSNSANLIVNAAELSLGSRRRNAQANMIVNSTLTAQGGVNLVIINQTLFNQATLIAQVRAIHIDPYLTWMVSEENRQWTIGEEIRTRRIEEETRTYIIEGA